MKGKACMVMETGAENRNAEGKTSWMEIGCGEGKGSCKYVKG